MSSLYDWSTTASSNGSADSGINFDEGQAPSTVNNSARQLMGRIAELLGDLGGALTAGGTANALTVTANSAFTTLATGRIVAFKAASDNTASSTLNVNSIGAKVFRKYTPAGEVPLAAGDIQAGGIYVARYDAAGNSSSGAWQLLNPSVYSNVPSTSDGAALGSTSLQWSDLYLASGAVVNFDNGNYTITHGAAGSLTFSDDVFIDGACLPLSTDAGGLGNNARQWADLFLASGAVINIGANNYTLTHSSGALAASGSISATAFNTTSDKNLKTNWRDFDAGPILDAIEIWHFDWKAGGSGYGVLAQDCAAVFPDAISEGEGERPWLADYSKFVPLKRQQRLA